MTARRRSLLLALATSIAALSCGGGSSTSGCVTASTSWTLVVDKYQKPAGLNKCPTTYLAASAPYQITESPSLRFNADHNGNEAPRDQYFRYWTFNTRDAQGNPRPPFVQDEDHWLQYREDFISGTHYYYMQMPMTVTLALPPLSSTVDQRDSLHATYRSYAPATFGQTAWAYVAGNVHSNTPPNGAIQGSSALTVGTNATWQHLPTIGDTTGYEYQWYVNGAMQSADTGASLSRTFTQAGSYTLRIDQRLVDTTYSYSMSVTVALAVAVGGPVEIDPYTPTSFSASASGGTSPYSYAWFVDGAPYGSGTGIVTPAWDPGTQHILLVTAADAQGKSGQRTVTVDVRTSCDPQDPNCLAQVRSGGGAVDGRAGLTRRPGPKSMRRPR